MLTIINHKMNIKKHIKPDFNSCEQVLWKIIKNKSVHNNLCKAKQ